MVAQLQLENSKNKKRTSQKKLSELKTQKAEEIARLKQQLGNMTLSIADKQSKLSSKLLMSPGRCGRHISPEKSSVTFDKEDQRDYTDNWVKSLSQTDEPKKCLEV